MENQIQESEDILSVFALPQGLTHFHILLLRKTRSFEWAVNKGGLVGGGVGVLHADGYLRTLT